MIFRIDQQLLVGAVVDEEGLIGVAVAEVPPQQRKDAIFRLDFRTQYVAVV